MSPVPNDTPAALEHGLGIKWEEPPKQGRRGSPVPWAGIARVLRRKPGAWARVYEFGGKTSAWTAAKNQRKGNYEDVPADAYEFCARSNNGSGGSALYGRFIGEDDE